METVTVNPIASKALQIAERYAQIASHAAYMCACCDDRGDIPTYQAYREQYDHAIIARALACNLAKHRQPAPTARPIDPRPTHSRLFKRLRKRMKHTEHQLAAARQAEKRALDDFAEWAIDPHIPAAHLLMLKRTITQALQDTKQATRQADAAYIAYQAADQAALDAFIEHFAKSTFSAICPEVKQ